MMLSCLHRLAFHLLHPWRKRLDRFAETETYTGNPGAFNAVAGNLQHFLSILFIHASSQHTLPVSPNTPAFIDRSKDLGCCNFTHTKRHQMGVIPWKYPTIIKGKYLQQSVHLFVPCATTKNILPTDNLDYNENTTVKALW